MTCEFTSFVAFRLYFRRTNSFCCRAFIDDDGGLNKSGQLAATLTLAPCWFRAIEEGSRLGCCQDIVDIAVLCSSQKSIYVNPRMGRRTALEMRRMFQVEPSDHINLAAAFNAYMHIRELAEDNKNIDLDGWCDQHYLNKAALESVREDRLKLGPILAARKMQLRPNRASPADTTLIRKALARAFCTHAALIDTQGDIYYTVHENTMALLEPWSALVHREVEWVVYSSLSLAGGKVYMKQVTQVEAEWFAVCLGDKSYFLVRLSGLTSS